MTKGNGHLLPLYHSLHAECYAVTGEIYFNDFYHNLLLHVDNGHGVADKLVGELGDMDESFGLDAEVHEATEVGDVGDDARQDHSLLQVVDGVESVVERELFVFATRVTSRFTEFLHDVGQGGHTHGVGTIALQFDALTLFCRGNEILHVASGILCHLSDKGVAFGMHGGVVQGICCSGDAEETCTLLKGLGTKTRHVLKFLT